MTDQLSHSTLKPSNKDHDWFVVAGGPSLKDFDWSLLNDKNCIAVNRSFEKMPYAKYIYFTDLRFWQWYDEELLEHPGIKATGAKGLGCEVERYVLTGLRGLDTRPGKLKHGNNSGYAAINLAYHLGAKRIILVGYDMQYSESGDSHWHDGYKAGNNPTMLDKMLPWFETLVKPLSEVGIEVINTSMHSRITCFKKQELKELL